MRHSRQSWWGSACAGKTSLEHRFAGNCFNDEVLSCIRSEYFFGIIDVGSRRIQMQVWDTCGQERFRAISRMYYRGAQCVMFVFDVTCRASFEELPRWIADAQKALPSDARCIVLGNKADLVEQRVVTAEEASAFASLHLDCPYFDVSAKSGLNVDVAFGCVAEAALCRHAPVWCPGGVRLPLPTANVKRITHPCLC